jgi:hypothetical protein
MAITIKKQSLFDWFVEDDSKPINTRVVAYITKVPVKGAGYGYEVTIRMFDFTGPYFYPSFKEAKACAMDPTAHP